MKVDHDNACYGILALLIPRSIRKSLCEESIARSLAGYFTMSFPNLMYFANTLALTSVPPEDRFNLWFGPILVQRR